MFCNIEPRLERIVREEHQDVSVASKTKEKKFYTIDHRRTSRPNLRSRALPRNQVSLLQTFFFFAGAETTK
jgi:hypothetical protein